MGCDPWSQHVTYLALELLQGLQGCIPQTFGILNTVLGGAGGCLLGHQTQPLAIHITRDGVSFRPEAAGQQDIVWMFRVPQWKES